MVADASIYSLIRQPQAADPMAQYGQTLQLRHLMDSSELSKIQRQKVIDDMEKEKRIEAVYQQANGDHERARQGLYAQGLYQAGMAADKNILDTRAKNANIAKDEFDVAKGRLSALGGSFATIANNPTHDQILGTLKSLVASGAITSQGAAEIAKGVPSNPAELPAFVKSIVTGSEHGLKTLEGLAPKVQMVDNGQKITPFNMNTLAGPVAPIQGATQVQRQQSPESVASNAVAWYNATKPQFNESVGGFIAPPSKANPNGSVIPLTMPNGAPLPNPKTREDVDALRKEFNSLPEVKNYREVVPIINSAIKAPNTAAGDFALIYGVGKILDPGSVVREGEMNMVIKSGSPAERVNSYLTYLKGEGRLTPQMRTELNQMLSGRVGEMRTSYDAAKNSYEGIAKKRGYDSADIFAGVPDVEKPSSGSPTETRVKSLPDPASHNGYTATDPSSGITYKSDGKRWVKVNG